MNEDEMKETINNNDTLELLSAQEQITHLKTELENSQEEVHKNRDLYLRLLADVENMKKRSLREREEYIQFATMPVVKKILLVLDDLERALSMSADDQNYEALYKGVEMIHNSLQDLVKA
ncbi:MAG: nucleotide exchange factor GrpE, partial [Armatimonadetes bacterium]|nr:nucleotide exchange factor GrpE [Armatimonadota bacterium]